MCTGSLSTDSCGREPGEPVGWWITYPKGLLATAHWALALLVDVTFILQGEDVSKLPGVVKGDDQKSYDAATPTQLWAYFFEESFLARFQEGRGPTRAW
jgi:hypothetical protein